jgi:hypothetical protein
LATPLVVSVHTVVSFDFAISLLPGWHTTIFPPYFVAGAIYSGFAMVLTLAIPPANGSTWKTSSPCATWTAWQADARHRADCRLRLYMMEAFMSPGTAATRMRCSCTTAPPALTRITSGLILCNILIPQWLWSRKVRQSIPRLLFFVAIVVNIGMWLERFIIVVTSLHRDFLPSSWGMYYPTQWDWAVYVGTIGFFLVLMILFVRVLPAISILRCAKCCTTWRPTWRMTAPGASTGRWEISMSETSGTDTVVYGMMAQFRRSRAVARSRQPRLCRGLSQYGCLYAHAHRGIGGGRGFPPQLGIAHRSGGRIVRRRRRIRSAVVDFSHRLSAQCRRTPVQ